MTALVMPNADVLIWQGELSGIPLHRQRELLSPAELARARRYRRWQDAERYVKARGTLRRVLAQCTGVPADALLITDHGEKPALRDYPRLFFNATRSGGHLAIAVAETPIGIDLESIRHDVDNADVARSYFHTSECAALGRLTGHHRSVGFYRIWTQKEAFVKALGCGVSKSLTSFAVDSEGGAIVCPTEPQTDRAWFGTPIDAIPGFCLALVSRFPKPTIEISELSRDDE